MPVPEYNKVGDDDMKITIHTIEDFINSEIAEWGFDYVEAKFEMGYEPIMVNGVWCWSDVQVLFPNIRIDHNSSSSTLDAVSPNNRIGSLAPSASVNMA